MKSALFILFFFIAGIIVGTQDLVSNATGDTLLSYALYVMLVLAGMSMGFDTRNFLIIRNFGLRILLLPVGSVLGTCFGAILAWGLLLALQYHISLRDVLGVGAGFGYYSLSSVMITRFGDAELGSVALIANVSRELLTLLFAPLLVRYAGGLAPVAAGGATTMDTCMPVIARYAGEQYAIMGIFSGMALTIAVPFFVTLIFTF